MNYSIFDENMGLFGNLLGTKNYAKMYMDAVDNLDAEKAHKIFLDWSNQSVCQNDANFVLTVVYYGAIIEKPSEELEIVLKRASRLLPVDSSLFSFFKINTSIAFREKGYGDLAEKYVE